MGSHHDRLRAEGIGYAIDQLAPDEDEFAALLARVESGTTSDDEYELSALRAPLDGFVALCEKLLACGRSLDQRTLSFPLPPGRIVDGLAYLRSKTSEPRIWAILDTSRSADEIAEQIAAAIGQDSAAPVSAFLVARARSGEALQSRVVEAAANWLRTNDGTSEVMLQVGLRLLDVTQPASQSDLEQLADQGHLLHHFYRATSSGWMTAAANASLLQLIVRPALPDVEPQRESAQGLEALRQVIDNPGSASPELLDAQANWLAPRQNVMAFLFKTHEARPSSRPWTDEMLRRLRGQPAFELNTDQYLERWQQLREALGDEAFDATTAELLTGSDLAERLVDRVDLEVAPLAMVALRAAGLVTDQAILLKLCDWCRRLLDSVSIEDWRGALQSPSGGPVIDLALQAPGQCAEAPRLGLGFEDAIEDHAVQVAQGEAVWPGDADQLSRLLGLRPDPNAEVVAQRICGETC